MLSTDVIKFTNDYPRMPFSWGTNDCSTFVATFIEEFSDIPAMELSKFRWRTKSGAIRHVKRTGKGIAEVLLSLGFSEVDNIHLAVSGDLLLMDYSGWSTAGIVVNDKVAWFVEGVGLTFEPLADIISANIIKILRVS